MRVREVVLAVSLIGCSKASTATAASTSTSTSATTATATATGTATATLTATPDVTASEGTTVRVPDDEAVRIARSLVDGGAPSHPFFFADMGPLPHMVFGIVQTEPMSPYTPIAAAVTANDFQQVPIEPLVDTPWNGWQVDAVMFEKIDDAGKLSPIVIAEYMTGIGPTGAVPFVQVLVYKLQAGKFVHARDVEKKLENAKNAKEVRARLGALKKAQ